jgi:hypothetical protein
MRRPCGAGWPRDASVLSRQRRFSRFRPTPSLRLVVTDRYCHPPSPPRSHAVAPFSIAGRRRLGAELPSTGAGEQRVGFLLSSATLDQPASLRRGGRDTEPSHHRSWSDSPHPRSRRTFCRQTFLPPRRAVHLPRAPPRCHPIPVRSPPFFSS